MGWFRRARPKPEDLERFATEAQEALDRGDLEAAARGYRAFLRERPESSGMWFDLGLVYKRLRRWPDAMDCNERAIAADSANQPAYWNLGIAATALARWDVARRAWTGYGVSLPSGTGEIRMELGQTPVRLDPAASGEVVWGSRIDPARVILESIPLPESGFRCGDVVLHDGEPRGERVLAGRTIAVFDVLARLSPSAIPTLRAQVSCEAPTDSAELVERFLGAGSRAEDWTESVRLLCKRCSEGAPGEFHEHDPDESTWSAARDFGLSATLEDADALLSAWAAEAPSRGYHGLEEVG